MFENLRKMTREIYERAIKNRGEWGDERVSAEINSASFSNLYFLVVSLGLEDNEKTENSYKIFQMAKRRGPEVYEENLFDFSRAIYLLTEVLWEFRDKSDFKGKENAS